VSLFGLGRHCLGLIELPSVVDPGGRMVQERTVDGEVGTAARGSWEQWNDGTEVQRSFDVLLEGTERG
jgi:hypothetical protein